MFSAKKILAILICISTVFLLSGCFNGTELGEDNFLSPPKPVGEMLDIKETLETSVQGKFTLKYPTAGEYRSAYVMCDLLSSGKDNFALAFYSMLDSENVTSMHLNLMKKVDDAWVSISDVAVAALGVEKLQIIDFNGDGVKEIAVGWNIYGDLDKSVMVYSLKGLSLVPVVQESYFDFICFDMEEKGGANLFVLDHNPTEGKASAKLYSFIDEEVISKGSCLLDGQITSFYSPVVSALTNGSPAVFLDAAKGGGTQTEVLYLKNGILTRANFENEEESTLSTFRNISVLCADINGDGRYDIPIYENSLTFHPEEYDKTPATMLRWCSYTGDGFETATFATMNYTDGYYIEIPVRWFGKVTVDAFVDSRTHTITIWDTKESTQIGELLKIRTVTEQEWDAENNGLKNYFEVERNEGLVYIANLGNYTGTEKITKKELLEMFHIIK